MAKTRVVGVRLDPETVARLAEMARKTGVTISMQARMILVAATRNGREAKA
jgi:antitoxin component of RelBE/YafQ-DinJ toxin-antitoxin module